MAKNHMGKETKAMSKKEKTKETEVLEDYEDRPVPEEKCFGWIEQGAVWLGCGFCLAAFSLGGQLAEGMGFWQAVLAIVLGSGILTIVGSLIGAVGAKTHLATAMTSRFTFGVGGAKVFGIIIAISLFGWFGYQCSFFGQSAVAIVKMATGFTANETLLTVIGGLAMMVTAIVGYRGIKMLSNFGVPLLFILVVVALIVTFVKVPASTIFSSGAIGTEISMGAGITLVVGSFIVGATCIPDFSRYSRKVSDSTNGCILGYFVGYIAIVLMGAIFAYAFQENDFTDVLINKLGFGFIAAIVLIIATWTTNDNNLYQSVLGITNATNGIVKIDRWKLTAVVGVISTAFGALGVVNIFVPFLSFLGVVIPPLSAVIICDYYILHKKNYEFSKISKMPTWNVNNCVAGVLGALVGMTMNSRPYGFAVPFMMKLSENVPSSIIAMVAGVVFCLVINAIHPVKCVEE
jgi:cytosine permease